MTTFLDTNILIFLLDERHTHNRWCREELIKAKIKGGAIITDIVYCEFSVAMKDIDDVNAAISRLELDRYQMKDPVLFRAGKAFKKYKDSNSGEKQRVLPDFIVGAAAEIEGVPLITNDKRFASYFPKLTLISPLSDDAKQT